MSLLKIDTLYLQLDYSQLARLKNHKNMQEYKTHYYIRDFKHIKDDIQKTFTFEYSIQYFKFNNYWFKVSGFKLNTLRMELIGLHQYHKDNTLKDNQILEELSPILRCSNITRIDLCKDSTSKPQSHKLKTHKAKYYKTTLYHNLYNKNYFSSYVYDKQNKNQLKRPLWRTEYSFKGILRAKSWRFQLRDLYKLERKCIRFIDKLPSRANKINSS